MQLNAENWKAIRKLFRDARLSSLHFAVAAVKKDGTPHVTPIGSLFLSNDMSGYYFEELSGNLAKNFKYNRHVCVMAVHSGRLFWIKSLFAGRFASLPAVRLYGTAGEKRLASPEEIIKCRKFLSPFKFFRGYDVLWKRMVHVRDIHFDSYENINLNDMTFRLE